MVDIKNCGTHIDTLLKINTLEAVMDTRHKMNMWFLRILGSAIILLTGAAITVGINLNSTLVTITAQQEVSKEIVNTNRKDITYLKETYLRRDRNE